jgi:ubiquinone/menaquinone biosynthesis C-methylase UbiE
MNLEPNFNPIARPYRWLEYLAFGKALENCRTHYLPQLLDCRSALILGDGDGRFTSKLLAANPDIKVLAVDISATMLELLRQRCEAATPHASDRLRTLNANALTFPLENPEASYDLVVTHFFLDCLTPPELDALITRINPALPPEALWLISDFRIPNGVMRLPAKLLIRSLYFAFRILTGLRATHLPDHATPLTQAGLTRIAHQHRLLGILTTELWQA